MKPKELEEYFKSDKSDWYHIDNEGYKEWNTKKVKEFWKRIRSKKDSNYRDYIFPKFERDRPIFEFWKRQESKNNENIIGSLSNIHQDITTTFDENEGMFLSKSTNFWNKGKCRIFTNDVDFSNVEFLDNTSFNFVLFLGDLTFSYTVFHHNCSFSHSQYLKKVNTNDSEFKGEIDFHNSLFVSEVFFSSNKFLNDFNISNSFFNVDAIFMGNSFKGNEVDFSDLISKNLVLIASSEFLSTEIDFSYSVFNEMKFFDVTFMGVVGFDEIKCKANFIDVNFKCGANFSDLENSELRFERCDLTNDIVFSYCNIELITFNYSEISQISFLNCIWKVTNRLILKDEKSMVEGEEFKNIETLYRQLKRNFDGKKDWELSGLAYISEMEMRKKRLWNEGKYYEWFIYWFYSFFGGYTLDFKKPIVSLIVLVLFSSVIYYFIDYDITRAMQRGIKGAIPYVGINFEKPFEDNWLIVRNIELLLSGTFLTFFILALRKRFKQ